MASCACAHALSSSHDLVDQQQLLGQSWSDVQPILLGDVVVINLFLDGGNGSQGNEVESNGKLAVLVVFILQQNDAFLDIVATVLSKDLHRTKLYLRNHQQ